MWLSLSQKRWGTHPPRRTLYSGQPGLYGLMTRTTTRLVQGHDVLTVVSVDGLRPISQSWSATSMLAATYLSQVAQISPGSGIDLARRKQHMAISPERK